MVCWVGARLWHFCDSVLRMYDTFSTTVCVFHLMLCTRTQYNNNNNNYYYYYLPPFCCYIFLFLWWVADVKAEKSELQFCFSLWGLGGGKCDSCMGGTAALQWPLRLQTVERFRCKPLAYNLQRFRSRMTEESLFCSRHGTTKDWQTNFAHEVACSPVCCVTWARKISMLLVPISCTFVRLFRRYLRSLICVSGPQLK
jgi:hypothetical protein